MGLSVRLAGYNLDADLLSDVQDVLSKMEQATAGLESGGSPSRELLVSLAEDIRNKLDLSSFTPETLSAAYARISRDPKQVTELRRAARFGVARARKSNENIIFGLGHASVAEHACFNFDVHGLSRLASEELQSHRLLSFTEKSQRYITIATDFVVPPEISGTEEESLFHQTIPRLFGSYKEICVILVERYLADKPNDASKDDLHEAENRAKEDARYLLPLACTTQMGLTLNARMIEHVVRDLSDHPLQELRDLGARLYEAVHSLSPSVVKYTERGGYPRENRNALSALWEKVDRKHEPQTISEPTVKLVSSTPDGESSVLRAIAFAAGKSVESVLQNTAAIWRKIFYQMGPHDGVLREFEMANMTFEAVISASCFAQLKRHRMMTLIAQPYDPEAGVIMPPSLIEAGLERPFEEAIHISLRASHALHERWPLLAPYLLTNAQQRKVLIKMNAREFYHLARLRCDAHAQWEIRGLAEQMLEEARALWPSLFMLACGKDQYAEHYASVFPSA